MSDRASPTPRQHAAARAAMAPRAMRVAWLGGAVLAAGLAGTVVWALSTTRLYESEAVVVYERGVQSGSVGAGAEGDTPRQVAARLNDLLMSRQRMEALIRDMKLYPSIVEKHGVGEAAEQMRLHLRLTGKEGYTFKVAFDAESREAAQQVLVRVLGGVLEEDGRLRLRDADETKKFLDTERKHADEDLKTKEGAISAFLTQHPQLATETGTGASAGGLIRAADRDRGNAASGSEIASLELQAAQFEEQLAAAGQRPGGGPSEALADPVLVAARSRAHSELQTAQRDLADKQARFTNEHPDVKAALRRVTDSEGALRHAEAAPAAPRPVSPPGGGEHVEDPDTGRVAALRRALAAVHSQIGAMRSRGSTPRPEAPRTSGSVVAIDTEWTRLNREVTEARERQTQLESKQFQAELMATLVAGGQGGRLVVADPPYRPTRPIAGGRGKIAMVGSAGSVLLGLVAMGLLALFDDRLYGARDVERIVETGFVVVIPRLTEKGG